jgi:predicted naringenin-chalcone synthase
MMHAPPRPRGGRPTTPLPVRGAFAPTTTRPQLVGLGTATAAQSYTQAELLDVFGITDRRVRELFLNGGIERRSLRLPPTGPDGRPRRESQGELLARHRLQAVEMGSAALRACLADVGATPEDVKYLVAVTTTGFLTPGLSARILQDVGLSPHTGRLDVVGMGCNAGLNGLAAGASWATAHPGDLAVVVCSEACSAGYVVDGTLRTAVVNSLFGDGAAAAALVADDTGRRTGPTLVKLSSYLIPEALDTMRYDWDDDAASFSFYLDPDVPYLIGAHAELAVDRLLEGTGLRRGDIDHWTVHSGGKKVIDALQVNLGLTRHDLRHTVSVLRDHGNVSSASFLFSQQRLMSEGLVAPGDHGVLLTMGPGAQLEAALVTY